MMNDEKESFSRNVRVRNFTEAAAFLERWNRLITFSARPRLDGM